MKVLVATVLAVLLASHAAAQQCTYETIECGHDKIERLGDALFVAGSPAAAREIYERALHRGARCVLACGRADASGNPGSRRKESPTGALRVFLQELWSAATVAATESVDA